MPPGKIESIAGHVVHPRARAFPYAAGGRQPFKQPSSILRRAFLPVLPAGGRPGNTGGHSAGPRRKARRRHGRPPEPPPLHPAVHRGRGRLHPLPQHRQGRVDPGVAPFGYDRRRRARRHPDAGEPLVRPLLRHDARRARLRRPAPGDPAERAVRLAPGRRRGETLLPFHPDRQRSRPGQFLRGPRARLGRHPPGLERRPLRPVDRRQGADHDGVPRALGHPVPLRAGRRVHRSATPTTARCMGPTDPNRYYVWTGWVGNDGKGGGPVIDNDEAGYDWTTYPERLEAAGRVLEDLPGRRRRPGRRRLLGLDRRRLHRQLRRQLAALLRAVPQRRTGLRALREGAHRHRPNASGDRLLRHPHRRRARRPAAAGVLDRRARGVQRAPELAGELRRLVRRAGPRGAHRRTPRCGARPSCSSPSTRTTASSTTSSRRCRRHSAAKGGSTVDDRRRVLPGERRVRAPARTGSARGCRCSSSRRGAPAGG